MIEGDGSDCIIEFWFACLSLSEVLQQRGDKVQNKCSIMETQHRRFWAKVYFIVESDLFPSLWQLHNVTFTSIRPIVASLITEKASLWQFHFCVIVTWHEFNKPEWSITCGNIDREKHNVSLIRQKLLHMVQILCFRSRQFQLIAEIWGFE